MTIAGAYVIRPGHYWFLQRPDELLIDLDCRKSEDDQPSSNKKARFALRRLEASIDLAKKNPRLGIHIKGAWFYPSNTPRCYHLMIRLDNTQRPYGPARLALMKTGLRLFLLDDEFRLAQDCARHIEGTTDALLIAPDPRKTYWRQPDFMCKCEGKHTQEIMDQCPVAMRIRGENRTTDYYGKAAPDGIRPLKFGRIL